MERIKISLRSGIPQFDEDQVVFDSFEISSAEFAFLARVQFHLKGDSTPDGARIDISKRAFLDDIPTMTWERGHMFAGMITDFVVDEMARRKRRKTIILTPEQEDAVYAAIGDGRIGSVGELIDRAIAGLGPKSGELQNGVVAHELSLTL